MAPVPLGWPDAGAPARDRLRRHELVWIAAVTAVVSALGFPIGWLWSRVTPKVEVVMTAQGLWYAPSRRYEEAVAGDGWFAFITTIAGVVIAMAVWWIARRHRGPLMTLALAVGCIAGAVIAAWYGHRIGLAEYERLARGGAAVGQHFFQPARLGTQRVGLWFGVLPRVQGAVLLEAAAAVTLYTLLAGFHRAPTLRDEDAYAQPAVPPPVPAGGQPVSWDSAGYPAPLPAPVPPVPGTATSPPD
jgi:hypothetical protein